MINVTVVTPIFNTQDYLHRCIKSVLSQKGVSLRYFLIDDGSIDNSASIAMHYQKRDPRVVFIKKVNEGQGSARNIGIKLAESEFIYFVDSDDYLGENTLSILYSLSKKYNLDICSPLVPTHYFDKPLEYIPCIPCKSQFINLNIIKQFNIEQPPARSGQDGAFSLSVLSHCNRIAMSKKAIFHYTHAREGSTFKEHLNRPDLVPTLLNQHYEYIEEHFDKYDLWQKNSLRLIFFVINESFRNRIDPNFASFTDDEKNQCFLSISNIIKKAYNHLPLNYTQRFNNTIIEDLISQSPEYLSKNYNPQNTYRFNNIFNYDTASSCKNSEVLLCNYSDLQFMPEKKFDTKKDDIPPQKRTIFHGNTLNEQKFSLDFKNEMKALNCKLDLAINSINNASLQSIINIKSEIKNLSYGDSGIIVSLTTIPSRISLVHYAIESIFNQTVLPCRIILWITDEIKEGLISTPHLEYLISKGLEIRKVKDVGPHTKLIYAIKEFHDKNIITIDDDIIYPTNMISCLLDQHRAHSSAIVANWARELAFDSSGKVKGVRSGKLLTPPVLERELEQSKRFKSEPSLLAFPYGTGGVLYPPNSLNKKVFEVETFKTLCPTEDDIWFKAMGLLNKTSVVVTNLGINPRHHCVTGSQHVALRHDNHGLQLNSQQMQNVFEYFDLYRMIFS